MFAFKNCGTICCSLSSSGDLSHKRGAAQAKARSPRVGKVFTARGFSIASYINLSYPISLPL